MQPAVITASVSVVVAVLVFLLNQRGQLRMEQRQARLARTNGQLRELYGPLKALVDVNEQIWESMRAGGLPASAERDATTFTKDWRKWRDHALMPANIKMRDLIIEHADLLIESDFPQPLRDFCAHVSAYEVLLSSPAGSEVADRVHISHPGSVYADHVRDSFARLKAEQQRLLRLTEPR